MKKLDISVAWNECIFESTNIVKLCSVLVEMVSNLDVDDQGLNSFGNHFKKFIDTHEDSDLQSFFSVYECFKNQLKFLGYELEEFNSNLFAQRNHSLKMA